MLSKVQGSKFPCSKPMGVIYMKDKICSFKKKKDTTLFHKIQLFWEVGTEKKCNEGMGAGAMGLLEWVMK